MERLPAERLPGSHVALPVSVRLAAAGRRIQSSWGRLALSSQPAPVSDQVERPKPDLFVEEADSDAPTGATVSGSHQAAAANGIGRSLGHLGAPSWLIVVDHQREVAAYR